MCSWWAPARCTTCFDVCSCIQVEDRPIVKEQITYVREHHPMEKEFIVETRPTGRERELTEGRTSEVVLSGSCPVQ